MVDNSIFGGGLIRVEGKINFFIKGVECPICFKAFPIQEIAEHADSCASWHVESVGETTTIDEIKIMVFSSIVMVSPTDSTCQEAQLSACSAIS